MKIIFKWVMKKSMYVRDVPQKKMNGLSLSLYLLVLYIYTLRQAKETKETPTTKHKKEKLELEVNNLRKKKHAKRCAEQKRTKKTRFAACSTGCRL